MNINMEKIAELLDENKSIEINFFTYEEKDGMYVYGTLSFTKERILEKAAQARYFAIGDVSFTNEKCILIELVREGYKKYRCVWDKENKQGDFHIINDWTDKKKSMKNLDEEEFRHVARYMK